MKAPSDEINSDLMISDEMNSFEDDMLSSMSNSSNCDTFESSMKSAFSVLSHKYMNETEYSLSDDCNTETKSEKTRSVIYLNSFKFKFKWMQDNNKCAISSIYATTTTHDYCYSDDNNSIDDEYLLNDKLSYKLDSKQHGSSR